MARAWERIVSGIDTANSLCRPDVVPNPPQRTRCIDDTIWIGVLPDEQRRGYSLRQHFLAPRYRGFEFFEVHQPRRPRVSELRNPASRPYQMGER